VKFTDYEEKKKAEEKAFSERHNRGTFSSPVTVLIGTQTFYYAGHCKKDYLTTQKAPLPFAGQRGISSRKYKVE
jgi:hypothetical protein